MRSFGNIHYTQQDNNRTTVERLTLLFQHSKEIDLSDDAIWRQGCSPRTTHTHTHTDLRTCTNRKTHTHRARKNTHAYKHTHTHRFQGKPGFFKSSSKLYTDHWFKPPFPSPDRNSKLNSCSYHVPSEDNGQNLHNKRQKNTYDNVRSTPIQS